MYLKNVYIVMRCMEINTMKLLTGLFFMLLLISCVVQTDKVDDIVNDPVPSLRTVLSVFDTIETDGFLLKWTAVPKVTEYTIYESAVDSDADYTVLDTTGDTLYKKTGLSPNTGKYYKIECVVDGKLLTSKSVRAETAGVLTSTGDITDLTTDAKGILTTFDSTKNKKSPEELIVLTLNLHTYQETAQDEKFDIIVKAIAEYDVDLIAFQECAQKKDSPFIDGSTTIRNDNMAYIITKRLKQYYNLDYDFKWDWAHYGWSVYEEGVAVVSKHPITASQSTWISTSASTSSIISRKAVYSSVTHPDFGRINLFSAHLHWRTTINNDQTIQIQNLQKFVNDNTGDSVATFVCGDFNMQPTEYAPWDEGYNAMTDSGEFIDTFYVYNPAANDMPEQSKYDTVKGDTPGRIDYIFMNKLAQFTVISSQIIFTPAILGTVTDHYGVLTRLEYSGIID